MLIATGQQSCIKNGNVRLGISKELMKRVPNAKKLLTFKIPNILEIKRYYIQNIHILYIFFRCMVGNISKSNIFIKKKSE
jgi:hypothetical protein